ncbi:MAG: Transcriptional regulator, TrmB [Candidatus Nomurabacteria bacterium GW2011_GWB1_37_5]|uniref:Transcriptional regulator, TrmB n=1 Tax=Candidatus Nomurabacteria bacterium GW2011_GWB1_37_5 TaxID=1618742 RepID=A0A0G0H6J4_9BACT|nr:MAG: Transcriptional regulator, TrmB [Candidatus Nomurabacteria bacterium GW2011_GWB1_37_5]
MLEKFLEDIGLSDKEAKVYLALLSVDNYSVLELAKKTNINRTTIYPVLEKLMKDGLVSEVKINKKVKYQAASPERLETFIESQRVKLNEQSKVIQDVIPQLKSLARESGEKPIVTVYDGREGIINSLKGYFQSADEGGTVYLVYPVDLIKETFSPKELEQFRNIRTNKSIKSKAIFNSVNYEQPASDESGERFKIDEKKYPIKVDLGIYKDRIRINTLGKGLSAIYIRSQDLADTLRTLFDLAYEGIKLKNRREEVKIQEDPRG